MLITALLLQAATPPDIQFDAHVTAREVRIRQSGAASLTASASPDAGSRVEVQAPPARGHARLRNVDLRVHAEARISGQQENVSGGETATPAPR